MASMAKSGSVTLHCDECRTELARREILMLATVPPSHCHLAVKQEKEDEAFAKLNKVENSRGGKSAQYCPYKVHCRGPQCGKHVGNITRLASKELICYKIENVYLVHDGEEIRAKKLLKIRERLEKRCGIEVVNVSHSSTLHSIRRPSKPMIYCDTSGLSHTSREIDSLTRQRPRDYQRELFLSVMRGNTLVYLPTGSGKTLVAAMVLSCMKKLNPDKLMVFLVDRIPLVYQQSHYIKAQVPDLRVETLVGEMEAPQQKAVHKALANQEIDVLVLTHQIFLNFLAEEKNPITRISDISVLVFDEAHHCHGNHQYNQIMEYYRRTQEDRFKPVVLGLSASPAGEATVEKTTEKLQDLLHNLSCEVSTPVESEDLAKNVNNPDTLYDTASAMNTSQVRLQRFIQDYIQHLKTTYMGNTQALELPVFSPKFRGMIRRLIDGCHGDKRKIKMLIAGENIMQMLSIVDVSEVLGYEHAMECLSESVSRTIHAVSPKDSTLKKMVGTHPQFIDLSSFANSSVEGVFPASDKYNILEGHIKQFVSRAQQDETSRGIIFVNMRKTAYQLCTQIRTILEVKEKLNPEAFVGHGQGSYDGMAWVGEQEVLLQNFRAGKTKLLISTSVLEEGLDVPVCNLVIRFEGAATLRALVQSRGRASRRPDSKFVVICNEKQKQEAEDVALKERNMEEAIRHLMAKKKQKSQAEQFGCDVKTLSLSSPSNAETNENIFIERFNPRITISVHYLGSLEHRRRVINFLENNFEVMSMKNIYPTAITNEGTEQKQMAFELEANEDKSNKEFRSKEAFIRHVTEQFCSRLTNRDEEPLPVWLQASLPRKRNKVKDSFHSLSPNSMFLGTLINRCHFRYEWPLEATMKNVQVDFDHSLKMLTIVFTSDEYYKLELRYHELEDFLVVDGDADAGVSKLFLTVKHPPRLFQIVEDELGLPVVVNDDFLQDDDEDDQDYFSDSLDESESESDSFSTDEEYPDVIANFHERSSHPRQSLDNCIVWERVPDILDSNNAWGQCFTYCFTIPCKESSQLIYLLAAIEKRFDKKAFYCRVKESFGRFSSGNFPSELPFDVLYAAQSVVSLHPVVRGKVSGKFSELLQSKPSNVVCAGLEQLKKALEQDKFCDPDKTLQAFLSQNKPSTPGFQNRLVPGHCALIKRVVITPTRLLMFPPEVMIKNRVLRQYETDDFLCVSIRDEDLSKLSAGRGSLDVLLDGVKRVLDEGLRIAGQRFHFLGSSNSQLRGHSCWFVGPRLRPDDIRRWMGDFSHIKCVASFMARMGQCFSTSIDTVGIEISQGALHGVEEDVKTADQKYCFSDGVGRISKELVTEVVKRIAKPFIPSAFQIRFAGFKGVLAVDPTLAGKQAFFRRSMCKFDSFHRRLEVLQTSRPQVVYLNHQVIMLLSNLGVPDEVFIDLQSKMLDRLAGMLVNEHDAVELLGTGAKMGVSYHSLSSAGIPLTTEPFFKSLVVAMYRNHINELLSRARILLPPAEARLMMGVMDEIGVLKPGQVFVQYSAVSTRTDREDQFNINKKLVLRGPVVVTRNPCLHPGDVRQLEAVEAPELSHLVDCVVFPRQGARPHPNEMAGGDLDGDLYFVCWSKSLLPREPNFPPMDYQAQEKHLQDEPITAAHMTKFVIDYIRSDQLGVIDNAHKALADQEEGGVESKICLHLAELHSIAVDAPKTGKWPKISGVASSKECPDFMMKSDKPNYPSKKVLGKLYRRCRKFQDTASEKYSQKMRVDNSFLLPGHDKYVEEARELYQQYRDKMEALMRLYGIETEAEVFTGCFLKLRNRQRKDKTEIAEIVGDLLFAIRFEIRREFFNEFSVDGQQLLDNAQVTNEMLLKASAWYNVAYTHAHDCANDSDPGHQKRLLGFPWFVNDVMLAIKTREEPPGSFQTLDVNATVGGSLVRLFSEEKTWLLEDLKERVRTKNSICRHLKLVLPKLSVTMIGSSATLLLHQKSDLDLYILPQEAQSLRGTPVQEGSNIPTKDQAKTPERATLCVEPSVLPEDSDIPYKNQTQALKTTTLGRKLEVRDTSIQDQVMSLEMLIPHLKEDQTEENKDTTNLFHKVRLVGKNNFPVLVCKKPTEKLNTKSNCDLSSSQNSLSVAILLSSYIKSYPSLLLVLRLIHRWCYVTGLSRNAAGAGNTSNILASMLLVQCMRKGQIQNFNEDHITTKKLQILQGKITDDDIYMKWEQVVSAASVVDASYAHLPRAELNAIQLAEILLDFFRMHETSFEREIPDPLARILRTRKFKDLLDKDHVDLVKEHMRRAYQLLALYGDVQIMLAISGSEDYNVIYLSPLLSSFLAGVEKSKAREIATRTGARSVIIRPRLPRSRNSAILEVKGSEPAIRAVERELGRMSVQASRDRVSLMSGCFVEGASLLLFEGSRNENDHVTLSPYDGPCHQTHDNLARHVALVMKPTFNEYTFRRFTEKFFQQLRVVERDFDPQIHGRLEFAVHFGRVYLFSIPHVLLEDGEPISIAMLRTNKRKITKQQSRVRKVPSEVSYADEQQQRARRRRRRTKRTEDDKDNRKTKRKRANPSRSSFYTAVHSTDRVKKFLKSFGFHPNANPTEKYNVDICPSDDSVEFYVRLDKELRFIDVKFPNLRWCMVDVKRTWRPRLNHDVNRDAEVRGDVTCAKDDAIQDSGHVHDDRMPRLEHEDVMRQNHEIIQDGSQTREDVILDGWETDVRFLLQSRYELQLRDIQDTKYAHYQRVLEAGNQAQSRPFSVQEDLWKDVRLIRFVKSTKFTRATSGEDFLSGLTVYVDEVSEYSRPAQEVDVFRRKISPRWEVSLEAALPRDLTEKQTVKTFLNEVWEFSLALSSFVSL